MYPEQDYTKDQYNIARRREADSYDNWSDYVNDKMSTDELDEESTDNSATDTRQSRFRDYIQK